MARFCGLDLKNAANRPKNAFYGRIEAKTYPFSQRFFGNYS
jgi:hypothetical protein